MDEMEKEYEQMARDAEGEREALEWCEAMIGDVADAEEAGSEGDGRDHDPTDAGG